MKHCGKKFNPLKGFFDLRRIGIDWCELNKRKFVRYSDKIKYKLIIPLSNANLGNPFVFYALTSSKNIEVLKDEASIKGGES